MTGDAPPSTLIWPMEGMDNLLGVRDGKTNGSRAWEALHFLPNLLGSEITGPDLHSSTFLPDPLRSTRCRFIRSRPT